MSWSVSFIGRPDAVKRALDKQSEQLSGPSKTEYDDAKPHLKGLVEQCVGEHIIVKLIANGHATFEAGRKVYGSCSVTLDQLVGLVE